MGTFRRSVKTVPINIAAITAPAVLGDTAVMRIPLTASDMAIKASTAEVIASQDPGFEVQR